MAYTDLEKVEAIIRLAVNKHNIKKTAEETGIGASALRRWSKEIKLEVPDLLDRAVQHVLASVPDNIGAEHWGVIVGILVDKWLLMHGRPTAITEHSLLSKLGVDDPAELDLVLQEAERILLEANSSGTGPGEDTPS